MKLNLAIFSPKQDSYSETFIQAHKKLPFNVRYYFGDDLPTSLEGGKSLLELSVLERAEKKWKNDFSVKEYGLLFSLKREKIDVVLAEYADTAVKTLDVIKFLGIPLVVHFHGYDASIHDVINSYADKYRQVFEYASSVIVVSNKMVRDVEMLGCPSEKIVYCPYGPNNDFFKNNPSFTNHQFVSVGRFVEKKAPHLTLLAFEKVSREYPEARLVMIGDGPLLNICLQMVEALGLSKKVIFGGVQQPAYIADVFEQSRALVQHSITAKNGDSEGTPVAILEAQAAGLPVISTFHAGIPDVVIHQETGFLVQEADISGMARYMVHILSDAQLAFRLGSAGRIRVKAHFTIEQHLSLLSEELGKAVKIKYSDSKAV